MIFRRNTDYTNAEKQSAEGALDKDVLDNCIQKALLENGNPVLEKVQHTLSNEHDKNFGDCLENPEILQRVLKDHFESNYGGIIESINKKLSKYTSNPSISNFQRLLNKHDSKIIRTTDSDNIKSGLQYTRGKILSPIKNMEGFNETTLKSFSKNNSENKDYKTTQQMGPADYMVAFSGLSESYCIGIVDMANSTLISANMNEKEWARYYEIFLNSMGKILPRFGGVAIKNGGDNLLYYFPESFRQKRKFGFICCIECSLAITEAHKTISEILIKEGLPPMNYRVSADYGKVVTMRANNSHATDLIGPPVNMCAKINHDAEDNGVVIGGDLYQVVRSFEDYYFKEREGFSIGLKHHYPVYSVRRK